jgi:hypothetical protein
MNDRAVLPGGSRVLGEIEVRGEVYRVGEAGPSLYEVVRVADGQRVGRFRGSPAVMRLLEPDSIDVDLLAWIVRAGIVEGFISDLPTD